MLQAITHLPLAAPVNEVAKAVATAKAARLASTARDAPAGVEKKKARPAGLPDGYGITHKRGIAAGA